MNRIIKYYIIKGHALSSIYTSPINFNGYFIVRYPFFNDFFAECQYLLQVVSHKDDPDLISNLMFGITHQKGSL